jgi:hypothetical protein
VPSNTGPELKGFIIERFSERANMGNNSPKMWGIITRYFSGLIVSLTVSDVFRISFTLC